MNLIKYVLKFFINIYIFCSNFLCYFIPKYILIANFYYRVNGKKFNIYQYVYNSDKYKLYNIKVINSIKFDESQIINNSTLINNCSIIDKDMNYKSDITNQIRMFLHYNNNKQVKWKYILVHLNIHKLDYIILSLNNNNLDEIVLSVKDLYFNKTIFSLTE